jgi:FkbM family methyltransferase
MGKNLYDVFCDHARIAGFADSYKIGEYRGVQIKKLDIGELKREKATIVISSLCYHQEQHDILVDNGISEECIVDVGTIIGKYCSEKQYFDIKELSIGEHEVFVDGGCYDGATTRRFLEWAGENARKAYAFEPEKDNYTKCLGNPMLPKDKVEIYPYGLWDKMGELHFESEADSSRISEDSESMVKVVSLDELIHDKVTYLKLDVEGSELRALKGAERLITTYKPKLAISLYHKPEDVWEIPELLCRMCPEYRFFLRHYTLYAGETVLYAIV